MQSKSEEPLVNSYSFAGIVMHSLDSSVNREP